MTTSETIDPPSPRVRASVKAIREDMHVCEKCMGEVTILKHAHGFHLAYSCNGECDRRIADCEVVMIEQAEKILIAYAISIVDRLT